MNYEIAVLDLQVLVNEPADVRLEFFGILSVKNLNLAVFVWAVRKFSANSSNAEASLTSEAFSFSSLVFLVRTSTCPSRSAYDWMLFSHDVVVEMDMSPSLMLWWKWKLFHP